MPGGYGGNQERILVCAPSNAAVHVLADRFLAICEVIHSPPNARHNVRSHACV